MSRVRSILVTVVNEHAAIRVHIAIAAWANSIDRRGFTLRYTVFDNDFSNVLSHLRRLNATVQEIVFENGQETYVLHHQGHAAKWQPRRQP